MRPLRASPIRSSQRFTISMHCATSRSYKPASTATSGTTITTASRSHCGDSAHSSTDLDLRRHSGSLSNFLNSVHSGACPTLSFAARLARMACLSFGCLSMPRGVCRNNSLTFLFTAGSRRAADKPIMDTRDLFAPHTSDPMLASNRDGQ